MFDAEALYHSLRTQLLAAYGPTLGRLDVPDPVALVGVRSGGAWVAERLAQELMQSSPDTTAMATTTVPVGTVNVTMHRDDFASKGYHGPSGPTRLPFEITGRRILLIDDVLYTGRTIRAALNELYDYGRPAMVELAVLVDRGGRELPVEARYKAVEMVVSARQSVVMSRDSDGRFSFGTGSRTDG